MAFGGFGFGAAPGGFAPPAAVAPPAADAVDRDLQVQLPPGTDTISAVNFSPNSQFVAYSSWDGKCGVFEVQRGAGGITAAVPKLYSSDFGAPLLDFKWAVDGSSICAVGCNKDAMLWNLATNQTTKIGNHDAPIKSVNWCPTLNCFATGGWDSTLRYFDPRSQREVAKVALPGKVNSMDVLNEILVLGTSDKKFHIFNLQGQPTQPLSSVESPLKMQTRVVRICHDRRYYLASSPEGRCAIRCTNNAEDNLEIPGSNPKKTYCFAFKCHRDNQLIYPVNALDAHPNQQYHSVFATAGGDGIVCFWDREKRARIREMKVTQMYPGGMQVPVTDCRWDPTGSMFAYAMGYDWAKGGEHYDPAKMPATLWLHNVDAMKDLTKKP